MFYQGEFAKISNSDHSSVWHARVRLRARVWQVVQTRTTRAYKSLQTCEEKCSRGTLVYSDQPLTLDRFVNHFVISIYIPRYSFSLALNDLATIGRMSLVRSLQLGIALDTAHQLSPWWGSAITHRCMTLSCWAWKRTRQNQIISKTSVFIRLKSHSLAANIQTRPRLPIEIWENSIAKGNFTN